MADEKDPSGKELQKAIGRQATKIATKMRRAKPEELPKLNSAMLLLNQAQMLVGVDDTRANRLMSIAKNMV